MGTANGSSETLWSTALQTCWMKITKNFEDMKLPLVSLRWQVASRHWTALTMLSSALPTVRHQLSSWKKHVWISLTTCTATRITHNAESPPNTSQFAKKLARRSTMTSVKKKWSSSISSMSWPGKGITVTPGILLTAQTYHRRISPTQDSRNQIAITPAKFEVRVISVNRQTDSREMDRHKTHSFIHSFIHAHPPAHPNTHTHTRTHARTR